MKNDLSKVKVGDKIWTIEDGWIDVVSIEIDENYPIYTENNTYTFDGKVYTGDKYPSAFLEYPFKEQPIEKDTLVWFKGNIHNHWSIGYYSHFEATTCLHHVFVASKKSTETSETDAYYELTTENPFSC